MLFSFEEGPMLHYGHIVYIRQEYALNFVPSQYSDCYILIGDVEVGFRSYFDKRKLATQVGGYCGTPTRWHHQRLFAPEFRMGRLLLLDETIEEGENVRLEGSNIWSISYDPTTSWVCFGETLSATDAVAVEFATDCGAILQANQLKALWVKPIFQ
jgi:hypothetical protein